jgi:hypothetical protein
MKISASRTQKRKIIKVRIASSEDLSVQSEQSESVSAVCPKKPLVESIVTIWNREYGFEEYELGPRIAASCANKVRRFSYRLLSYLRMMSRASIFVNTISIIR